MKLAAFPLLVVLVSSIPCHAATIHVPADQPNIQAGINAAVPGDTVLVAPGTYTGAGNKNLDFGGIDLVLRSESGAEQTRIDCEGTGRGLYFHNSETNAARVEGFTIQRGSAGGGGGAYCFGSAPIFAGCIFQRNSSGGVTCWQSDALGFFDCTFEDNTGGSALYAYYCDLTVVDCRFIRNKASGELGGGLRGNGYMKTIYLTRCTFRGNDAGWGGGLGTTTTTVKADDCVFEENTSIVGGGVYWDGSGPSPGRSAGEGGDLSVFRRCVFRGNSANAGGGLNVQSVPLNIELDDCIVEGNTAASGGGMRVDVQGPTLRRCTFYANGAPIGGGIYLDGFAGAGIYSSIIAFCVEGEAIVKRGFGSGCAELRCSDLYGNAGGDWVDCAADQRLLNGNLNADPQFCNAPNGDLHLASSSPCAPENSPTGCGLIGALPVGCATIDVASLAPLSGLKLSVQPNPVSSLGEFTLDASAIPLRTMIEIYDIQGRLIQMLIPQDRRAVWVLDSSVPRGVYFARLRGTAIPQVVKFAVVR